MVSVMTYWSISSIELTNEAKRMGLQVDIIDHDKNTFYIESENKRILFKSTDFGGNSSLGFKICQDKGLTYKMLEKHNLPIAQSIYVDQKSFETFDDHSISKLSFPLVIKPISEAHGDGVMMNILDYDELYKKLQESLNKYDNMVIQEQVKGDEVRVLVVHGKVILARNRIPAHVIGDGKHTITQLIEIENKNPLRGEGYEKPLAFIQIDDELISYINKQQYELSSKPQVGEYIQLRGNSNIGTGGTMVNVTGKMHNSIKEVCIQASQILGLAICGVDILSQDITKSLESTGGIILEINATPSLGGERELTGVNTAKEILKSIFITQ